MGSQGRDEIGAQPRPAGPDHDVREGEFHQGSGGFSWELGTLDDAEHYGHFSTKESPTTT
jgi:hypothetical protein